LREADPKAVDPILTAIRAAKTAEDTVGPTEALRDLYYVQIDQLRRDVLGTGDNTTNIGCAADILK
jgi:hypothetical protein